MSLDRAVQLVEVDVVRTQPTQAVLQCRFHVSRGGALPLGVDSGAELGRHYDFGPVLAQGAAKDFLATRPPVNVGRIKEIDARIEGRLDDPGALGLVGTAAEVVATKAHKRNVEGADLANWHVDIHAGKPTRAERISRRLGYEQ